MGIFHSDDGNSTKSVCTVPRPLVEDPTDPIVGSFNFYHLNMILSGAATAFILIVMFILMQRHATHLSKPNEQLNILRICAFLPIYAVGSFLSVVSPEAGLYITPWLDVAQAFALANFFLLLCEFISPSHERRELFLSALTIPAKGLGRRRRGAQQSNEPIDGISWYRKKWIAIFQYPIVSVFVAVVSNITEAAGVFCMNSSSPHFAHLWMNILHTISITSAIMAVLNFYGILKQDLKHHKPLAKLLAFKLLIGLQFLLQIIFWILRTVSPSPLTPSTRLNFADLTTGIPLLVTCLEMVPFSVFFHWAYDVNPYYISKSSQHGGLRSPSPSETRPMTSAAQGQGESLAEEGWNGIPTTGTHYQGGPLGVWAWLAMLDPREVLSAFAFAFKMFSEAKMSRGYSATANGPSHDMAGGFGRGVRNSRTFGYGDTGRHAHMPAGSEGFEPYRQGGDAGSR